MSKGRPIGRVLVTFWVLGFFLLWAQGAYGATKETKTKKPEEQIIDQGTLDELIKTLEDPKKRSELIKTLKALKLAQQKVQKEERPKAQVREYLYKLTQNLEEVKNSLRQEPYSAFQWVLAQIRHRDFLLNMGILLFACVFSLGYSKWFKRRLTPLIQKKSGLSRMIYDLALRSLEAVILFLVYNILWIFMKLYSDQFAIISFTILLYLLYALFVSIIRLVQTMVFSWRIFKQVSVEDYEKITTKIISVVSLFFYFLFIRELDRSLMGPSGLLVFLEWLLLLLITIRISGIVKNLNNSFAVLLSSRGRYGYIRLLGIAKIVIQLYVWFSFIEYILRAFYQKTGLHSLVTGSLLVVMIVFVLLEIISNIARKISALKIFLSWSEEIGENFAKSVLNTVKNLCYVAAIIIGAFYLGQIWVEFFGKDLILIFDFPIVRNLVSVLVISAGAVSLYKLSGLLSYVVVQRLVSKGPEVRRRRIMTIIPIFENGIKVGTAFVAGVLILNKLGVNVAPILAGAGIVGLAVGFGAQTFVKDLINGLFIVLEEAFHVGDVVTIGGKSGIVEMIGLRATRLRDLEGNLHLIPNSQIDIVSNMTKEYSRALIEIGVAYKEDVDQVMEVLKGLGEEMGSDPDWGKDILEPMEILGLDRLDDSQVVLKVRFKTRPMRQWAVRREFLRRVKKRFDQLKIEIPFPHLTLYMGEPKEGNAPPMSIRLLREENGN